MMNSWKKGLDGLIVEIDKNVKNWIGSKGNQITVKILEVDACCAPPVQELVAVPGKPKTYGCYHPLKIDHLTIYLQKHLCEKDKLTLKLTGISFLKTISAKIQ